MCLCLFGVLDGNPKHSQDIQYIAIQAYIRISIWGLLSNDSNFQ